jgi:hypothetical protein
VASVLDYHWYIVEEQPNAAFRQLVRRANAARQPACAFLISVRQTIYGISTDKGTDIKRLEVETRLEAIFLLYSLKHCSVFEVDTFAT